MPGGPPFFLTRILFQVILFQELCSVYCSISLHVNFLKLNIDALMLFLQLSAVSEIQPLFQKLFSPRHFCSYTGRNIPSIKKIKRIKTISISGVMFISDIFETPRIDLRI